MLKRFVQVKVFLLSLLVTAQCALAADNMPDITTGLPTDVQAKTLADKIVAIAVGAGALIGAVAVGMLIYVGFNLATATGDRKKAEIKEHATNIFIGLGVVALAVMIVGFAAKLIAG